MEYLGLIQQDNRLLKLKELGRFVVPRVEVVVTLECTLRCSGCVHLIGLHKEHQHFSLFSVSTALTKFLEHVDACICVGIMGGEPFLSPFLAELISICAEHPKVFFVDITTNATIVPSMEVIKSLKKENILVSISEYPASTKMDELKSVFDNHNIKYSAEKKRSWIDYGDLTKKNKNNAQLMCDFANCYDASYYKTLLHNRFFHCSRAAFSSELEDVDCQFDYFEICNDAINIEGLKDFYMQTINATCDYCDRAKKKLIASGVQSAKIN